MVDRSIVKLHRGRECGSFNEIRTANRSIIDRSIRNVERPEVFLDFRGREKADVMRILPGDRSCLAFSSNREIVVTMLEQSTEVVKVTEVDSRVADLSWGIDARLLISTDGTSKCTLWDVENSIELDSYSVGSQFSAIDFNSNGQIVATSMKGAHIIDTRTGFGETKIAKKRALTSVRWSVPSRKILYATDIDQSLLSFDIRMLRRPMLEQKLPHSAIRLHSSPDGQYLFINATTKASLIDAFTLQPLQSIHFVSVDCALPLNRAESALCSGGTSSILAIPVENKVYRIDFSPSINHGTRPMVHSILHGHASICKSTAFDPHHLHLYSGSTEILRWIAKKEAEETIEREEKRNGIELEHLLSWMLPKLDDDLFIEPPNDEDVIYGDYNDTMDGESSNRPYIRLTTSLRNITRNSGTDVRLRCDAIGTAPISFEWKKNHAPVEKSKRVRIRNRDNTSRLLISSLDVLDSAFYECIASNSAGSVNSTAILKVKNAAHSEKVKNRPSTSRVHNNEEDYDEYELDMDDPRGRLPSEEDSDLYSVPLNAAGPGYLPTGPSERWLDDVKVKEGQCVLYRGEACRTYLAGRHIRISTNNREDMYDIDRNLRAAVMFIDHFDKVKPECKRLSHAVACFHMYKVCDSSDQTKTNAICKEDCTKMTSDMCPSEMAEAAAHDLIGDNPRALFPTCSTLPPDHNCINILKSATSSGDMVNGRPRPDDWCYTESGMNYQGMVSVTQSGKECMEWSGSTTREFTAHTHPQLRHSANYCRNPQGRRPRPWCYSSPLGQEEYCDIPMCPPHLVNQFGSSANGIGNSSSIPALWLGLGPTIQLSIICGGAALALIALFLICVCCCRKSGDGGGKGINSSSHPPPSLPNIHSAPHSTINPPYYRKMNGTSTPMAGRGVEMTSLLSGSTRIPMNALDGGLYDESMSEPFHVLDISSNSLIGMHQIGYSSLGVILSTGTWSGSPTGDMPIVAKISSRDIASRVIVEDEMRRVASLSHPNVLCLLGMAYLEGESLAAIYEHAVNGSLHALCRIRAGSDEGERETHLHDFLSVAIQISGGLEYLSLQGLVHKDVAARNVLVAEGMHVKLADIASMVNEYSEDYVNMGSRTLVPLRWTAREAIEGGRLSTKSDVWSFGVTLWEMYSYGRQPYEGYSNHQITQLLATRQLLESPPGCPTNMYSVMVECWHDSPDRRPSFSEMHRRLQTWGSMSPAPRGTTSSSSHSGSSGRGGTMTGRSRVPVAVYPQRGLRRQEDASPLMPMRAPPCEYTDEDGDSD